MTATELHLLLRDIVNIEAFAKLLESDQIIPVIEGDLVVNYNLTAQGRTRLAGMTLPLTTA